MKDYYDSDVGWFLVPVKIIFHSPTDVVQRSEPIALGVLEKAVSGVSGFASLEEATQALDRFYSISKAALNLINKLPPLTGEAAKAAHALSKTLEGNKGEGE